MKTFRSLAERADMINVIFNWIVSNICADKDILLTANAYLTEIASFMYVQCILVLPASRII